MKSRDSQTRQTAVAGDNNVVGNNNMVNSPSITRTEVHHHQHNHRPPGPGGTQSKDDAAGILLAAGVALVTGLWLFLKHAVLLYAGLKLVAGFALALVVFAGVVAYFWPTERGPSAPEVMLTGALCALAVAASLFCEAKLHPQLLEIAAKTSSGIELWTRLSDFGQRVAIESGLTALTLTLGVTASAFAALRIFALTALGANEFDFWSTRWLRPFRPSRGGVLGIIALALALALASGLFVGLSAR